MEAAAAAPRKATPQAAAEAAVRSIGLGFDVVSDVRLKYCKRHQRGAPDPWLIDLHHHHHHGGEREEGEGELQDIVLPGGITVAGVTKSIKCDKGERVRFRSDVLSFQQVCVYPARASSFLPRYGKKVNTT
jgi:hypothetical protein